MAPLLRFFLLALALSWAGWIPYAASRAGLIAIAVPAEIVWLAEYGPAVAALILTWRDDGVAGVRALIARLGAWRVGARWYLAAIGITPAVVLLVLGATALAGRPLPDPSLLSAWAERFRARNEGFTPSLGLISALNGFMALGWWQTLLVFTTLAVTNGGVSEEPGWRGWLLPRMQARYGALRASLLVALCWALWHTGSGFWQVVLTTDLAGALRFVPGYLGRYLLLVAPLAVYYTWIYNGTGGSLLLVVLLHAAYNMTVTVVTSAWQTFPLSWFLVTLWGVAVLVLIAGRREHRERERDAR